MNNYGRDKLNPLTTIMKSDVENMKPAEEREKPKNANLRYSDYRKKLIINIHS